MNEGYQVLWGFCGLPLVQKSTHVHEYKVTGAETCAFLHNHLSVLFLLYFFVYHLCLPPPLLCLIQARPDWI